MNSFDVFVIKGFTVCISKRFYHAEKLQKKVFGQVIKAKCLLLLQDIETRRLSERQREGFSQGWNARKVISEVYASFVLQCTVTGRQFKHKMDVEA